MERQDTRAEDQLLLKRRKIDQADKDRRLQMAMSSIKGNPALSLREALREAAELKDTGLL
jgi:hypothetical protein